jgi:hypothetical protein
MNRTILGLFLITAGIFVSSVTVYTQDASKIDAAFEKFWAAKSPVEAERMVDNVVKSGVTFDEAVRRLKAGRKYTAQKTGIIMLRSRGKNGLPDDHFYALNVPANYDPSRRYQVRFQLHGGVGGRATNEPRGNGESPLPGAEQIYVVPYSWVNSPWWSDDQVRNLSNILDTLKRTYNVDENRVVISGVSDGGTGAYYIGMRDTTPYASFLPLNGFIMVLANPEIDDGRIFPNNLRNKPMFVVNGGKDPLYPTADVEPFVKHLMSAVDVAYYPQPEAGHNTSWWPTVRDTFEQFVADHPRDPHPEKLTWETANIERNRAHWLVIDKIGSKGTGAELQPDLNSLKDPDAEPGTDANFVRLFERPRPSARVDLVRHGNTIQAATRNVDSFTILLSPDKFDLDQPIKVVANGRPVFEGRVERNLKTLMTWAARDNDRTMLYGSELPIKLSQ